MAEKETKKKSNKKKAKVAKTVFESIPYSMVYPNGMIMLEPGIFSKTYSFDDINFNTESEDKQAEMLKAYAQLLSKFPATVTVQLTVFNHKADVETILKDVSLKPQKDNLYEYREDYNDILREKIKSGRNDIQKERYFTVTIEANDVISANMTFATYDREINEAFAKINKNGARALSIEERLAVFHDIYNQDGAVDFSKKAQKFHDENLGFSLEKMRKSNIMSKELIAPGGFVVKANQLQIGDTFAKSFFITDLPTVMDTRFLSEITNIPCGMLTSYILKSIPKKEATKMVKTQNVDIKAEMIKKQQNAVKNNFDPSLIADELSYAREEAKELMDDITMRNQKIFYTTLVVTIFGETETKLNENIEIFKMKVADFICQAKVLLGQQMLGFNSSIPFGKNFLSIDRVLTTESVVAVSPFAMQELLDKDGHYYGLNQETENMIVYNRRDSELPNGLILGKSGSGKSFIAKGEIITNVLSTNDDILIIDPDREYKVLAEKLGGQVITIANGSNTFINPLDMDINYSANENEDPVAMKCDYLVSLCETIVGKTIGLTPYDINVIHKCGKAIYEPYLKEMEELKGTGITCNRSSMPTLMHFYNELMSRPEPEAHRLAMSLELYCIGNYDIFAHRTNINPESRLLVYDIKDIAANNKELAMQVCLNDIWNRVIDNFAKKKRTWVYLDEFYLLLQTQSSATFLQMLWKRIRKWKGIMTGITQDIEDCLVTMEGRAVLNNSGFLLMMNQSPIGRVELQSQFGISDGLIDYIKDKGVGTGLMYNGRTVIPFDYKMPTTSKLYRLMSTKPKDMEG